jgi:hypothetical protein
LVAKARNQLSHSAVEEEIINSIAIVLQGKKPILRWLFYNTLIIEWLFKFGSNLIKILLPI